MSTLRLPFAIFVVVLSGWVAASCGGRSDLDFDGHFATYDGGRGGSNSTPKVRRQRLRAKREFSELSRRLSCAFVRQRRVRQRRIDWLLSVRLSMRQWLCDANEQVTCPSDCPPVVQCGNGRCEPGENPQNCSVDCGRCGNGTL